MSSANHTLPLVINWHLTEACNFSCKYCYAHWNRPAAAKVIAQNPARSSALLAELWAFLREDNPANPLRKSLSWHGVRLNLAGGEPLLLDEQVTAIVSHARELGFEVSMITNGSRLTSEVLSRLAGLMSWIGVSIDSSDSGLNRAIGRLDRQGRMLDLMGLAASLAEARSDHPSLQIKVNTVVNALNWRDDLSPVIESLVPAKWKVLRVLPVLNNQLEVTDEQFGSFVRRHNRFASILCAEDNTDMRESYLMVDPHGRFFQNDRALTDKGYSYSHPILEVGAAAAFAEMRFNPERFVSRYVPFGKRGQA
ncbi:viperin family antiviral radical SAM protein [Thauera sp. AutoDN2]|uniref:viperin family antiviral radical SAM protein n=1 Tax=Thauera sp. AutoDN2 TaxID=3416051 RepID=UPI003F4B8B91